MAAADASAKIDADRATIDANKLTIPKFPGNSRFDKWRRQLHDSTSKAPLGKNQLALRYLTRVFETTGDPQADMGS